MKLKPSIVWLNFIEPLPLSTRILRYGLLFIGSAAFVVSMFQLHTINQQQEGIDWQLKDQHKSAIVHRGVQNQVTPSQQEQAQQEKHALALIQTLNTPWNSLFDGLETALNKNIAINTVTPNLQQHTLTIEAAASDVNAAIDFSDRVKADASLRNVHITQEELDDSESLYPLKFILNAEWQATHQVAP